MFHRYTGQARQVVVEAQNEARGLKHNYIGTEHILLGLVRENEGVAARMLLDFDADAEKIRNEIIRMLADPRRGGKPIPPTRRGPARRSWEYLLEPWPPAGDMSARRDRLNDLGDQGWELVGGIPAPDGTELAFRRQVS